MTFIKTWYKTCNTKLLVINKALKYKKPNLNIINIKFIV